MPSRAAGRSAHAANEAVGEVGWRSTVTASASAPRQAARTPGSRAAGTGSAGRGRLASSGRVVVGIGAERASLGGIGVWPGADLPSLRRVVEGVGADLSSLARVVVEIGAELASLRGVVVGVRPDLPSLGGVEGTYVGLVAGGVGRTWDDGWPRLALGVVWLEVRSRSSSGCHGVLSPLERLRSSGSSSMTPPGRPKTCVDRVLNHKDKKVK